MKNKRHMSLMAEVLVGSIGSMLFVTVFLCVSYMVVMLHGIKQSCINSVGQTMETLNKEVSGILGEYDNMVVDLSNVITALDGDRDTMKRVITNMGKGLSSDYLLYYATAEQIWDGGTLISHSGWEAPSDFDMQSRLWHKNAVNNQNKICYTEPFSDVNTGKLIVTISYRVLDDKGIFVVKTQSTISGGINHSSEEWMFMCAYKAGFYCIDKFILEAKARLISAGKYKKQVHARRYTSVFYVFQKDDRIAKKFNYIDMIKDVDYEHLEGMVWEEK